MSNYCANAGAVGLISGSIESYFNNEEFDRALRTVERSPKEAISSACNILESVRKVYIEGESLEMLRKKTYSRFGISFVRTWVLIHHK